MNIIDSAIDSIMDLIDSMDLFAPIKRGALGTSDGLCCEVGPSEPETVFMDKNKYIVLDLTLNGKNMRLDVVSDALNTIHTNLTMMTDYPESDTWEIVDVTTLTEPQIIGREESNMWIMASALNIKIYTKL